MAVKTQRKTVADTLAPVQEARRKLDAATMAYQSAIDALPEGVRMNISPMSEDEAEKIRRLQQAKESASCAFNEAQSKATLATAKATAGEQADTIEHDLHACREFRDACDAERKTRDRLGGGVVSIEASVDFHKLGMAASIGGATADEAIAEAERAVAELRAAAREL